MTLCEADVNRDGKLSRDELPKLMSLWHPEREFND